jgi:hypothetical protein
VRLIRTCVLRVDHLVHAVGLLWHHEVEGNRAALCTLAYRLEQPGGCRRLVGDDEDMGRL